jgi:hypothetical protein
MRKPLITRVIKALSWIDEISRVTLLFWTDPSTSWQAVAALIGSSAILYAFATLTVHPAGNVGERLVSGALQSLLLLMFASVAGIISLCLGKWFGSPAQAARRLTRLLVMVWIVSVALFGISNWLSVQPWWDLFPRFITALICSGMATLLVAINTLLRWRSRETTLTRRRFGFVVLTLTLVVAFVEAIFFRRVVLLEPFEDATSTLMSLLH